MKFCRNHEAPLSNWASKILICTLPLVSCSFFNKFFSVNFHQLEEIMFGFGMPELLVILAIVLVMFGAGRLPEIGGALGKSIRNFKKTSEGKDEIRINPADEVS